MLAIATTHSTNESGRVPGGRTRRYPQVAPVEPTVDAVWQEVDPALRRLDADLDEALVERRHVGVEGGREPLGREWPAPEAPRPPSGLSHRGVVASIFDDRRRVRVVAHSGVAGRPGQGPHYGGHAIVPPIPQLVDPLCPRFDG